MKNEVNGFYNYNVPNGFIKLPDYMVGKQRDIDLWQVVLREHLTSGSIINHEVILKNKPKISKKGSSWHVSDSETDELLMVFRPADNNLTYIDYRPLDGSYHRTLHKREFINDGNILWQLVPSEKFKASDYEITYNDVVGCERKITPPEGFKLFLMKYNDTTWYYRTVNPVENSKS